MIEGVAAPEAANNATAMAGFIPLLSLGIPTTPALAILLGTLMINGLTPGPMLFQQQALLVWTVLAGTAPRNTANLVGVYKTTDDAALPAQSLIGGRDQTIILQPVADAEQNIAPSVRLMQLDLPRA